MPIASTLKVARTTGDGYCLKVEGAGTMRQSRAAQEFVTRCVADGGQPVTIDLSDCRYPDSTFLGCLVALHRRFNRGGPSAVTFVSVATPSVACLRSFETARMDALLTIREATPATTGPWVVLEVPATEDPASEELARHIIDCHRQLAELGGPSQEAFRRIADAFERELRAKSAAHV